MFLAREFGRERETWGVAPRDIASMAHVRVAKKRAALQAASSTNRSFCPACRLIIYFHILFIPRQESLRLFFSKMKIRKYVFNDDVIKSDIHVVL